MSKRRVQAFAAPASGEEPDVFVPDPKVCAELGITSMTLWRYTITRNQKSAFRRRSRCRGFGTGRMIFSSTIISAATSWTAPGL
jgi:hypothetical protein